MRTFDIPYVKAGYVPPVPNVPLDEMTLQDITKKYLRTCAKSNGLVSECKKCQKKCAYGERAISLAYGLNRAGDTGAFEGSLLQFAQMQNELRRQAEANHVEHLKEEMKEEKKEAPKKRRINQDPEGWFEEAMAQPDPVKYVMDRFNKTKTQAKKKIYMYRYLHKKEGLNNGAEATPEVQVSSSSHIDPEPVEAPKETAQPEVKTADPEKVSADELLKQMMDRKLEILMDQQEKIETEIKAYQAKLTKVKEQIETICKTMDILKEV